MKEISRQQLVSIFYKYAQYSSIKTPDQTSLNKYSDANSITSYAIAPMKWAVGKGLITGRTETSLAPRGVLNRAELATILMRLDKEIRNK